jgi:hypothetical protein
MKSFLHIIFPINNNFKTRVDWKNHVLRQKKLKNHFLKHVNLPNSHVFSASWMSFNFLKVDAIFIWQSFQRINENGMEAAGQLGPGKKRVVRCSITGREEAILSLVHLPTLLRAVLGIRIRNRIRMFLGLPDLDPDPLVRGTDPSFFTLKVLSGLKSCLQNKILTQDFSKKLNF